MRLATFTHDGTTRIGVVTEDGIIDLAVAAPELPRDMAALLAPGDGALAAARRVLTRAGGRLPLADVILEAPVPRPPKFLAIELNYADHVRESGLEPPAVPQPPRFLQIGDVVG